MLCEKGDVIKIDVTGRQTIRPCEYPKSRTDATMWLQFRANFVSRYIEMRMRRVYLSMPTEGTKAFSNGYGAVVWKGEVWTQIFLKTEQNNV